MTDEVADTGAHSAAALAATAPSTGAGGPLAPATPAAAGNSSAERHMADSLVKAGHWTQQQADAALAADAAEQQGDAEAPAEAVDAEPFNAYAAVADMKSTLTAQGIEGRDAVAADQIVTKGLERAPTHEQNVQEMGEVQQSLESLHGKERANNLILWARKEFNEMCAANPNLRALAERSGAGNSIMLITQLGQRGWAKYNAARFGK